MSRTPVYTRDGRTLACDGRPLVTLRRYEGEGSWPSGAEVDELAQLIVERLNGPGPQEASIGDHSLDSAVKRLQAALQPEFGRPSWDARDKQAVRLVLEELLRLRSAH